MIDRRQNRVMSNQRIIAFNTALVLKVAARINENVFTECDIFPEIRIKRRKYSEFFVNRLSYEPVHNLADFFGSMIAIVQLHCDF